MLSRSKLRHTTTLTLLPGTRTFIQCPLSMSAEMKASGRRKHRSKLLKDETEFRLADAARFLGRHDAAKLPVTGNARVIAIRNEWPKAFRRNRHCKLRANRDRQKRSQSVLWFCAVPIASPR